MKKVALFSISILLIIGTNMPLVAKTKPRLAILDLQPQPGVIAVVAEVSTSYLKEVMVASQQFTVIERSAINTILLEQAFQQSGCTDTSCAVKIGRLLAANTLMFGKVTKIDERLVISAQVVNVEAGQIELAATETASGTNDLERTSRALATKILKQMAGKGRIDFSDEKKPAGIRHLIPGWVHIYYDDPLHGAVWMSAWALGGLNFINARTAYTRAQDDYSDLTLPLLYYTNTSALALNYIHFEEKRASIRSAANRANIAAGVFLIYWGVATILGYRLEAEEQKKQAAIEDEWDWNLELSTISNPGKEAAALQYSSPAPFANLEAHVVRFSLQSRF
ncbi:MAG: hypothetical protein KDK39_16255 [Leptospiraceae bacterium]|nr:hypothetical protein [Leptospiraceae bacterium]